MIKVCLMRILLSAMALLSIVSAVFGQGWYPDTLWVKVIFYDYWVDRSLTNPDFEIASSSNTPGMVAENFDSQKKPIPTPLACPSPNSNPPAACHLAEWFRVSGSTGSDNTLKFVGDSSNEQAQRWYWTTASGGSLPNYLGRPREFVGPNYSDSYDMRNIVIYDSLPFIHLGSLNPAQIGVYEFARNEFFWLDGRGFGEQPAGSGHNFGFTMELHTAFTYKAGLTFTFTGDDDTWTFINGKRVIDLGGRHSPASATISLDTMPGFVEGQRYPIDFFYAERHTVGSAMRITSNMIAAQPFNNAPGFISAPDTLATEDQPWLYTVLAVDVDAGDAVAYSLRNPPSGMAIAGNKVAWTPTNANVGSNIVIIRATDSRGAFSDQTFRVRVVNVNDSPSIISSAPTAAVQNQPFQYQAQASDPDVGDVLTWQLTTVPTGMSISASGLVTWTPTPAQIGSNNVVIQVRDAAGLTAQQSFSITVTNINDAPVIADPTAKTASEDVPFTLQLTAVDPDGNQVFWFVVEGPDSLKINMSTGLLTWTPRQNLAGTAVQVKIRATDAVLSDTTTFSIAITAVNDPPVITTVLPGTFRIDTLYSIPLTATDEEGNPVTWSISRKPATMSIVGNFLVWAPMALGTDTISIIASDGNGFDTLDAIVQVTSTSAGNSRLHSVIPNVIGLSVALKAGSITITAGLPSYFSSGTITLFSISGKKLAERSISGSGWHTFSVANIPAGAHLLRLNAGGQMIMRKVSSF